jgi:hypothetical protein
VRTKIMEVAQRRAEQFQVNNVLVATNTGKSIRTAQSVFGEGYCFFAVGNPASAHERGLVLHNGINKQVQVELEASGITVVVEDQSLFQRKEVRSFYGVPFEEIERSCSAKGHINAISILYNTLQLWGDGPRVCLEISLMAADAGVLPLDADCLAIACPSSYCDLPDAAVVLHPAKTENMFTGCLRIKDVALCPTPDDVWFSQRPLT